MTKKHRHQRKHNEENHHHHKKHHHHHQKHKKKTIDNPILKVLLEGVYDADCVLSKLRGCPHLLKDIWRDVRRSCLSQISLPNKKVNRMGVKNDGELGDGDETDEDCGISSGRNVNPLVYHENTQTGFHSWSYLLPLSTPSWSEEDSHISFPEPSNLNINMMPFIVSHTLESCR